MSIKVTNWVWAKSESRNGARLVMLALADRADDKGFAWPSIEDICERAKLSERAVQKGIAKLVEIGELQVESGGGRRVRNRYQIVPKPRTSDGVTDEYPRNSDGVTDGKPRTSDGVSPEETPHFATETPSFATETPSIVRENPVKSAGEPSVEPPREPSENHHHYPAPGDQQADRRQTVGKDDIDRLKAAMLAAGIDVPWRFDGDDEFRVLNDIGRLGIPRMINHAANAAASADKPPFSSRWFYNGWHRMEAAPAALTAGNVVALRSHPNGRPLPGTDTTVAGWDAVAAELRAKENPA